MIGRSRESGKCPIEIIVSDGGRLAQKERHGFCAQAALGLDPSHS